MNESKVAPGVVSITEMRPPPAPPPPPGFSARTMMSPEPKIEPAVIQTPPPDRLLPLPVWSGPPFARMCPEMAASPATCSSRLPPPAPLYELEPIVRTRFTLPYTLLPAPPQ